PVHSVWKLDPPCRHQHACASRDTRRTPARICPGGGCHASPVQAHIFETHIQNAVLSAWAATQDLHAGGRQ
ncbi:hypothetical protein COCSUDRAFT_52873, partial [Coccomyxa subellipsoidea C-169]